MIREDEPTKPSTKLSGTARSAQVASNRKTSVEKLGSILRGDLDWIVMKALDKDRTLALKYYQGFADKVPDDELKAEVAVAHVRIGQITKSSDFYGSAKVAIDSC